MGTSTLLSRARENGSGKRFRNAAASSSDCAYKPSLEPDEKEERAAGDWLHRLALRIPTWAALPTVGVVALIILMAIMLPM